MKAAALLALCLFAAPASADPQADLERACQTCHQLDLVQQQRLTDAQWAGVLDKMARWGAVLPEGQRAPLAAALAQRYGPDAGPYLAPRVEARSAEARSAPTPDGPFGGGDAVAGAAVYAQWCIACHGPDAQGQIGTLLTDRPILYQAAAFAEIARDGVRLMPPLPLSDADLANLLAHLRTLD